MAVEIGRGKKARRAYGFDDIALAPPRRTRDPDDLDVSGKLGAYRAALPPPRDRLDLPAGLPSLGVAVAAGGCAPDHTAPHVRRPGAGRVLVGVGPGAACTARGVLGSGVPQATAIAAAAAGR